MIGCLFLQSVAHVLLELDVPFCAEHSRPGAAADLLPNPIQTLRTCVYSFFFLSFLSSSSVSFLFLSRRVRKAVGALVLVLDVDDGEGFVLFVRRRRSGRHRMEIQQVIAVGFWFLVFGFWFGLTVSGDGSKLPLKLRVQDCLCQASLPLCHVLIVTPSLPSFVNLSFPALLLKS